MCFYPHKLSICDLWGYFFALFSCKVQPQTSKSGYVNVLFHSKPPKKTLKYMHKKF